jgi:UDP-N-acetylglucosamine--N-acetylmuramyl-(pentapeptide) pyrophosphoryl-undecaprenol N-acetylglucosamine transferase
VGTERGLENRVIPGEGFRLERITVAGLKGMAPRRLVKNALALPKGMWQALRLIRQFDPNVVIGVGGYSSGPPVLAAALMGIPALLQEQNASPGLTNRILGRFVNKVAAGFEEARAYFGSKTIVTGNPVRADFARVLPKEKGAPFTILIFGGSQGAQAINAAVVAAAKNLPDGSTAIRWIHQTGEHDFDHVRADYLAAGVPADVRPFFDDMAQQFARADLLICRAGAITLAEICAAGKAAILIPFPQATDDHQRKNAEALVQANAAELILQQNLNGPGLAQRILYYYEHPAALKTMEQNSRALGKPDATERIVNLVAQLAGYTATGT